MAAIEISGKLLAQQIQIELKEKITALLPHLGRPPGLAVVLVGDNPASQVYVKSKTKNAEACGINVTDVKLPSSVSDESLSSELMKLSSNDKVDGILLQLPLPSHLNEFAALSSIDPTKDVDGLHPYNQGLLLRGRDGLRPCTPLGVMALISKAMQELGETKGFAGKHAVVVGRSILVGKPAGLLLLEENCTVELAHSKTINLAEVCSRADILVAAVGRPRMLTKNHVKPGAIVIDVGINRDLNGALCGDVDFDSAAELAGAITPVPGGVGPMTIAMLLKNTYLSALSKSKRGH